MDAVINVLDIVVDEVENKTTQTQTISVAPQTGNSRCLLVLVNFETASDVLVTSVTWGGTALEEVAFYPNPVSGAPKNAMGFYLLKEVDFPSTISDLTVTTDSAIDNNLTTIIIQLENIDQTSTVADISSKNITSSDSLTLSSLTNAFYLWCGNEGSGQSLPSLSPVNTSVLVSNLSDMSCVCSYLNNTTGNRTSTATMPVYNRAIFSGIVLKAVSLTTVVKTEGFTSLTESLREQGYSGTSPELFSKWLSDQGYSGQVNEAFYKYLYSLGYRETLPDMYYKWAREQ